MIRRLVRGWMGAVAGQWLRRGYYLVRHTLLRPAIEPELAFLLARIQSGDTVLDIGANFGFYTMPLARAVGPSGAVHAFEPIPDTADALEFVARALGARSVSIHRLAVSDFAGELTMCTPRRTDGTPDPYLSHVVHDADERSGPSTMVHATTVDAFSACLGRISVIKCDVEGEELRVMRGARRTLDRDRPLVLCEVSEMVDRAGGSLREIFEFFGSLGYRPHVLRSGELVAVSGPAGGTVNYFLLPPDPRFGTEGGPGA